MSDGTKADDIAFALEEAIVSGEIPPGSTLRQEHLSEQFDVSRTPVREALRRLGSDHATMQVEAHQTVDDVVNRWRAIGPAAATI